MNDATFTGRLVANPNYRTVKVNGVDTPVCNATLACDDRFGTNKKTVFVTINAWRGQAESIAKYMTKGRKILVKGPVYPDMYTTKNAEGKDEVRLILKMTRLTEFEFQDSPRTEAIPAGEPDPADAPIDDDQVPFEE